MKIFFSILFAAFHFSSFSQVQGLTQSAEGKSTIPIRGTAVVVDLAKTDLSFGYNNINRVVESKKIKPIFGVSVKVKNEEGLGNLFSAGDLVASGNANAFVGISFSNAFGKSEMANLEKRKKVTQSFDQWQIRFRTTLKNEFQRDINALVKKIPTGPSRTNAKRYLDNALGAASGSEESFIDAIKDKTDPNAQIQLVYDTMKEIARKKQKEFEDRKKAHIDRLKKLNSEYTDISYQRFTIFGFGGISAIEFKKFEGADSANLANSFTDIYERGGNIGLGVNYQWRNIWLGLTYSYESTNNFSLLKKKDYTLRKTVTINPLTLIEETKTTAYSGKFGEVEVNNLNADVVFRLNLDKDYKNILLINPYVRASIFSRDTSLLLNKTNIGIGAYFISNSKFSGGIYFELPDVNNNAEKKKPLAEQNLQPAFEKLTFGIVAKFSLSAIVNW